METNKKNETTTIMPTLFETQKTRKSSLFCEKIDFFFKKTYFLKKIKKPPVFLKKEEICGALFIAQSAQNAAPPEKTQILEKREKVIK